MKVLLLVALVVSCASAQTPTWDTTGNSLLSGSYYIREVFWQLGDAGGDLSDGASIYGVITFTPSTGKYSFSGLFTDSGSTPSAYTTSGSYSISASGYGFMDDLGLTDTVFGLVSNGIFIGSTTENLSTMGYNTMAIASPIASPQATNATFKGTYAMVDLDSPSMSAADTRDALITMTADGNGNLTGTTAATGYIAANGSATRQNFSGVKYVFSNGAGNITFGGSLTASNVDNVLLEGNHYVYISPDGNFIFGGSPTGWDMFVGVRTGSGAPSNFSGLYYQAGMDFDYSQASTNGVDIDSYMGSFNAGSGSILDHQRILQTLYNGNAFDFTFGDTYRFNSDGSSDSTNTSQHYIYGENGAVRIGIGNPPFLGISVALAAPSFSGPGVYLNPTGIANSASFAPFTEQVAPGEFLTLAGTGLTTSNNVNTFFPTKLGGVQVLINNVAAPIYYALNQGSYDLISVLVPYETALGIANIQVVNNGTPSNTVSVFVGATQPGSFTQGQNGISYVEAQRVNAGYSLVTPSNPAQPGDSIVVYTTGFGAVSPSIADGSITPSTALTSATSTIEAFFDGATSVQATVGFAGLTPGLIGLYQMNITVPTGLTAGDNILEIVGLGIDSSGNTYEDSDNFEALISVGSGSLGVNAVPGSRTPRSMRPRVVAGRKFSTERTPSTLGHPVRGPFARPSPRAPIYEKTNQE